jgi:hypothetical protein
MPPYRDHPTPLADLPADLRDALAAGLGPSERIACVAKGKPARIAREALEKLAFPLAHAAALVVLIGLVARAEAMLALVAVPLLCLGLQKLGPPIEMLRARSRTFYVVTTERLVIVERDVWTDFALEDVASVEDDRTRGDVALALVGTSERVLLLGPERGESLAAALRWLSEERRSAFRVPSDAPQASHVADAGRAGRALV